MRLVACTGCRAHFDVTDVRSESFSCHCGRTVASHPHEAVDVPVHRCSACGASIGADAATCSYCRSAIVRDPTRLGLVCPECYGRSVESAKFCAGCGVEFRPQPLLADGSAQQCPACEQGMRVIGIAGLAVHECGRCAGLWVPGESFDALIARVREARTVGASAGLADGRTAVHVTDVPAPVAYRRCPVCANHMHRKNFGRRSGVIVDWCRDHGTWLDADELEHIAAFVDEGGLERPVDPEAVDAGTAMVLAEASRLLDEARQSRERPTLSVLLHKLLS